MKPVLKILDSVHTKANPAARELILPAIEYEETFWKKSNFGGGKYSISKRYAITGRKGTGGTFLTGLLPRIKAYMREKGYEIEIDDSASELITPSRNVPRLKGITFRPDQKRALRFIRRLQRGIVKFPTGTGKTIIALGAFSIFEHSPRLFLCHTKDLLLQTVEEIGLLSNKPELFALGGGYKPSFDKIRKCHAPIVVSTIQTFRKYKPSDYSDFFDFTIIDEAHNLNKKKSMYSKVMEYNLSPIKIGLTATPPIKKSELLVCEGFLGPIIAELSMSKGIKKGIIAKPIINLIPVPEETSIKNKFGNSYKKTYEFGIVKNETRNCLIVDLVKESIKNNEIVLVIVEQVEHAKILQEMLKSNRINTPIVQGSSKKEDREKIKNKLKTKKLKGAICTKVWREGINIPALNHIINAHGMKSEKIMIQAMGRGLRTSVGKDSIKLSDLLDPYKYLAEHAIIRLSVYIKQGWM